MNTRSPATALPRCFRALLLSASLLAGLAAGLLSEISAQQPNAVAFTVLDTAGTPLAQAIVWAVPMSGQSLPAPADMKAEVRQRDALFIPAVTPVRVGTAVSFPNLDTVRHNVYSFSPAKTFSLSLYLGTPDQPVVFDKPGEVVIGCNIHDRMLAYVLALDTPYFAKTGANGQVAIAGLVPGDYELHAWYPDQREPPASRRISIGPQERLAHQFVADLSPPWQTPRGE